MATSRSCPGCGRRAWALSPSSHDRATVVLGSPAVPVVSPAARHPRALPTPTPARPLCPRSMAPTSSPRPPGRQLPVPRQPFRPLLAHCRTYWARDPLPNLHARSVATCCRVYTHRHTATTWPRQHHRPLCSDASTPPVVRSFVRSRPFGGGRRQRSRRRPRYTTLVHPFLASALLHYGFLGRRRLSVT